MVCSAAPDRRCGGQGGKVGGGGQSTISCSQQPGALLRTVLRLVAGEREGPICLGEAMAISHAYKKRRPQREKAIHRTRKAEVSRPTYRVVQRCREVVSVAVARALIQPPATFSSCSSTFGTILSTASRWLVVVRCWSHGVSAGPFSRVSSADVPLTPFPLT